MISPVTFHVEQMKLRGSYCKYVRRRHTSIDFIPLLQSLWKLRVAESLNHRSCSAIDNTLPFLLDLFMRGTIFGDSALDEKVKENVE
ncbi:hypothetical protein GOODEAATRI_017910 [Goodea atripinnis]|uniref:Uncharacterized protein n=1 Tax=Goodea atripinnis TaxID=208336 RepID=A0ABV0N2N2_9TELE